MLGNLKRTERKHRSFRSVFDTVHYDICNCPEVCQGKRLKTETGHSLLFSDFSTLFQRCMHDIVRIVLIFLSSQQTRAIMNIWVNYMTMCVEKHC